MFFLICTILIKFQNSVLWLIYLLFAYLPLQLVQDLIRSHDSIWGCRHKLSGSDCLRYVNRHEEFRDSRHEPLSKAVRVTVFELKIFDSIFLHLYNVYISLKSSFYS